MTKDKNIRISQASYKILLKLNKETNIDIKYLIEKIASGDIKIK